MLPHQFYEILSGDRFYDDSVLPLYLRYDNWDILDGLLLLSGISPKFTEIHPHIDLKDHFDKGCSPYQPPDIKLKHIRPLNASSVFNHIYDNYMKESIRIEESIDYITYYVQPEVDKTQASDYIYTIKNSLSDLEYEFMNRLKIWYTGDHWDREGNYIYPVVGFLEWATVKGLYVPWYSWALECPSVPFNSIVNKVDKLLAEPFNSIVNKVYKLHAEKQSDNKPDVPDQIDEEDEPEIDIDELAVCAESDLKISIKVPGKRKKSFFHNEAGFKRSSTKEWKALLETLTSSRNLYSAGIRHKNKLNYDNRLALLKRINDKLFSLISENFPNVKLPDDRKLYEWCQEEEQGTYKFKFNIVGRSQEGKLNKAEYNIKSYKNGELKLISI